MAQDVDVTLIGCCHGNWAIVLTRFCFLKAFSLHSQVSSFSVFCWASFPSGEVRKRPAPWEGPDLSSSSVLQNLNGKRWLSFSVYVGDFHPCSGLHVVIDTNNCLYETWKACYYGKNVMSLSILLALGLMLNISVKFCQRKQAIVLTWILCYTTSSINMAHALFLVSSFDVCIKIVHLVAVKRNLVWLALNIRVIVKETGLFCCCCVDLFQCIDSE